MKGFDPEFEDLVDYILIITGRIWEGRDVGAIRRYYAEDCIVRTPTGVTSHVDDVVAGTLATLHAFPDRQLLGEDVIWSGDEQTGFLSSHRILSPMHHRGDGAFGPATGRFVRARTIADCAVKDNRIYEEWLVRDQAAIVKQIGRDPREFAAQEVARELEAGKAPTVYSRGSDIAGTYRVPGEASAEARIYADTLRRIWIEKDLAAIAERYDPACALELPGGMSASGHGAADRFWLGYLAALPDAAFEIDHLIGRDDPGRAARVAARWSVRATHSGHGAFGAPSGAEIYIMGICHAEIVAGKILREWVLVDELAIWRQIAIATG